VSEGFSAEWLSLREPHDAAARSPIVTDRLAAWRRKQGVLRVLDLGAGTGSNLRCTAPGLGGEQSWTLVEWDAELIAMGQELLRQFARGQDASTPTLPRAGAGEGVQGSGANPAPSLAGGGGGGLGWGRASRLAWTYRRLDLARDLERLEAERPDLISASALLDLVAEPWLARLAALRARADAALHVVLTYDGRIGWDPPDPTDAAVAGLVNRHQRTDKGFGPALGPDAVPALRRLLADAPGELLVARSDWRLCPRDREIQSALLAGYAEAATAISPLVAAEIAAWRDRRARPIADGASRLTVGHLDLLFLPAAQASRA
jgi:hypothetical protein